MNAPQYYVIPTLPGVLLYFRQQTEGEVMNSYLSPPSASKICQVKIVVLEIGSMDI
jgi:hypothetical protein